MGPVDAIYASSLDPSVRSPKSLRIGRSMMSLESVRRRGRAHVSEDSAGGMATGEIRGGRSSLRQSSDPLALLGIGETSMRSPEWKTAGIGAPQSHSVSRMRRAYTAEASRLGSENHVLTGNLAPHRADVKSRSTLISHRRIRSSYSWTAKAGEEALACSCAA